MSVTESRIFAALGEPTRLQLIQYLSDGNAHPINKLTATTSLTRQAVTKHLNVLQNAELVETRRVGRENRFTLQPIAFERAQDYLDDLSVQWGAALNRLDNHLQDKG